MGVLLSVDEWDSKPEPAFDIDMSDLAGLIEESWSVLPGSLRERCCRTLIMASFSMIWACRVLILFEKCKEKQCTCTLVSLGWGSQCPQGCDYNSLGHLGRHRQGAMELTALNTGCLPACQSRSRMRERHWDTHPPLAVGSCSKQPRKGLWDKAESYMQDMRPTKRWVLTHFGESVLDLTPGKTLLWDCQEVAGARGLIKMPWREKWNNLHAKNLRQDFSALAHGTKTGFECYVDISLAKWASGISYHCYRWKHKNFWFSGVYPNNLFKIPVLKKPDRTKLHLTFPPCRDTSCWQAGSLPPPSECELPARCRSWGWASGWSPSCPWERAVEQMRDQLRLLLSPQQHKIIAQK